jgi:hypothetical protein
VPLRTLPGPLRGTRPARRQANGGCPDAVGVLSKMTVPCSLEGVRPCPERRCRTQYHAPTAELKIPASNPIVRFVMRIPPDPQEARRVPPAESRLARSHAARGLHSIRVVRARVIARRVHPERPAWEWLMWLTLALLVVAVAAGCGPGARVSDTGMRPDRADGTISGTVRGAENAAIEGRVVRVVNLETDERHQIATNDVGGFTVNVSPGPYRVELTLRPGESIVRQPGVVQVSREESDARANFIIVSQNGRGGVTDRSTRPRPPASRLDPGLGSPMA